MNALKLREVHVAYGSRTVIDGVGFEVRAGELCALLGLNGSGKSTLMRAVCGLLPCRAAELAAGGRSLLGLNERERARLLCHIPQRGSAVSGVSVVDLLLMGYNPWLGLLDRPTQKQREAAVGMLGKVGLSGFEDRLFEELSEGQRQLVMFARALVQDAPVMLMDEPDSALDFVNRHSMLELISRTVKREKKAGLITLHDPNFAMAYCDRLLLLKGGVLAGDVSMRGAGPEELTNALSGLYGEIEVVRHGESMFMLKG